MTDSQDAHSPSLLGPMQHKPSPPSSPPSPGPMDLSADAKLSRKREREVSLEPVTTPKAVVDVDSRLSKETRTPAKKNRRHLDSTEEEEDTVPRSRSNSPSPPLSVSPPQELKMKVRQISQGVEDLNWRNMRAAAMSVKDAHVYREPTVPESPAPAGRDSGNSDSVADDAPAIFRVGGNTKSKSVRPHSSMDVHVDRPPSSPDDLTEGPPSDADSAENSRKRKYLERGTSQGPQENGDARLPEPLKRPRDDIDGDDNPRETKRPSPPPEADQPPKSPPTPPAVPKLGGFMAYASTSSPFASVKGRNIFLSDKPNTPAPTPASSTPLASPFTGYNTSKDEASSSAATATKRSGFEAFSSFTSPFSSAAARSKSPALGSPSKLGRTKSPSRRANPANVNAFSSYASGGIQSFAVPMQKRARAGSPSGGSSRSSVERNSTVSVFGSNGGTDSGDERDERPATFGEKLRAGRNGDDDTKSEDEQSKVYLEEQDLTTGEEEEETIHQVRGKLFSLSDGNQWRERGTGTLKLNVRRSDGSGARLVMRKEAVYTLLLNVTLFQGMRCNVAQDPRYLRFSVIEDGITTHYNLRVSSAKIAQELLEEINANIPSA